MMFDREYERTLGGYSLSPPSSELVFSYDMLSDNNIFK